MAIPKMKIYRLDENYSPDSDTDLKSLNDDEAYPFVEKVLDLNTYEELVGVTYRDTMACISYDEDSGGHPFTKVLSMFSDGEESTDNKKTEFVTCDGWKKGRKAVKVQISTDNENTYSSYVPEDYFRINYIFEDAMFNSGGNITDESSEAVSKRKIEKLQIEFGQLIYADTDYVPDGETITNVKIEYSVISHDIQSYDPNDDSQKLSLENGYIYDGTQSGRLGVVSGNGYRVKTDENGFPLKVEGNLGYKIKIYPCRQLVALKQGIDSPWNADLTISDSGSILIEDCQSWILTLTDERHPRVFQRISSNGYNVFRELLLNEQYTITNVPGDNGKIDIKIQLSQDYYNVAYDTYVYPTELFIRYNEELDVLPDVLIPDYLSFEGDNILGDEGILTPSFNQYTSLLPTISGAITSFSAVPRQIFKMAIESGYGYDSERDFLLSGDSSSKTIDLSAVHYSGIFEGLKLYVDGELVYTAGTTLNNSPFTVGISGSIITITPKSEQTLPNSLLISYFESHTMGFQKINNENPWAFGYRICCYEKTKIAKEFVSSFRNWVSDHLNNNPDIFYGWQEYQGSSENSTAISYLAPGDGYSIIHREGVVSFKNEITQTTIQDLKNWPPSGSNIESSTTVEVAKKFLSKVYAKFAYYDGITDANNALFREFSAESGVFKYRIIDDPTYSNMEDKRWIIRNDDKMPTTFFHKNQYIPTPNYVETGECELFTPYSMNEGEKLLMNLADYRRIAIKSMIASPDTTYGFNGDVFEKDFELIFDASTSDPTSKVGEYSGAGAVFHVYNKFQKIDYKWNLIEEGIKLNGTKILNKLSSRDFDPDKSIQENIEARQRYIHLTNEGTPFNVVFEVGENNLLIYAEKK